jgi:uncharacterized protein YqgC (DUF456 family)
MQLSALAEFVIPALVVVLLVGGVVGSVTPLLPGGVLSIAGVLVFWWHTGFTEPSIWLFFGLLMLGVLTVVIDYLAGAISAKAGGASMLTTVVATVVGFVGLLTFGPLGFLAGTALTVFAVELYRNGDVEESVQAAGVTLAGMLTSNLVQLLFTGIILVVVVGHILL